MATLQDAPKDCRPVKQTVEAIEQSEGVGARVRRSIGRPEIKNLDPFLLLPFVTNIFWLGAKECKL